MGIGQERGDGDECDLLLDHQNDWINGFPVCRRF